MHAQIRELCSRVSDIRTEVQFRSATGEAFAAPLAAVIAPMAFLLELALLEQLGAEASALRRGYDKKLPLLVQEYS